MASPTGRRQAGLWLAANLCWAGLYGPTHAAAPGAADPASARPRFVLINQTAQHDYDLALRMSLKIAEDKSGIENALVLLDALPPGQSIEQAAADAFTRLRVGARRHGRGILYLYSRRENVLKIEVSYDLEPHITDLYCRRMEDAAKAYMLSELPQDFLSELIITTNLQGMSTKAEADVPAAPDWYVGGFLSGGGGAQVRGYRNDLSELEQAIERMPAHSEALLQPSTDPDESVRRYLASLDAGLGDPRVPLLTQGSAAFRAIVPRNAAQQRRIFAYFQAASPYRLLVQADFAIAAPQPGHSNLPIVLRRGTDRLWYIDEVKSWMWFHRFEDSTDFFVKYADNPFMRPLKKMGWPHMDRPVYEHDVATPRPPAYPYPLKETLRTLEREAKENPADARTQAALGDFYLFEIGWQRKAIEQYELASRIEPGNATFRWRLVDLYLNASRAQDFLAELKWLADAQPGDRDLRRKYDFYAKGYAEVLE
jgi:hypothetical protein